jgi:integrase
MTGPRTFATKSDASAFLSEVEADLRRGTYVDHRRGRITFSEWVDHYTAAVRKAKTTEARDASVIRKYLLPELGRLPLSDITPMRIQELVNRMSAHLDAETVRTDYGVLRAILNAAVNDDRLVRSPCRGIRLPPKARKHRRTLCLEEIEGLAAAMPGKYRLMVHLGAILGLRWSEVIALRVSSLELLARPALLHVREAMPTVAGAPTLGRTKSTSSTRSLPLPPSLTALAATHLGENGLTAADSQTLLFQAPRGGPIREPNFRGRVWHQAVVTAALDGLTFQDLRRTAMTRWGEAGLAPKAIQILAGHSDARLSQEIYQQVTDTLYRDAAERLERLCSSSAWDEHSEQIG